jgi:hypothetical protein
MLACGGGGVADMNNCRRSLAFPKYCILIPCCHSVRILYTGNKGFIYYNKPRPFSKKKEKKEGKRVKASSLALCNCVCGCSITASSDTVNLRGCR